MSDTVKWAETLLHLAAHPDPVSMHCAVPAHVIESAAHALAAAEARVTKLQGAAKVVIKMLELGDNRLLARVGPCGGRLPELSPEEWGTVYRACCAIAKEGA